MNIFEYLHKTCSSNVWNVEGKIGCRRRRRIHWTILKRSTIVIYDSRSSDCKIAYIMTP